MKLIRLTQGKFAKVDDDDYDYLIHWKWCAAKMGGIFYAVNGKSGLKMHRLLLNIEDDLQVDHIDADTLNNQKYNLRKVTNSQNQQNRRKENSNRVTSSIYKGVCFEKDRNKWAAHIRYNNKFIKLGRFNLEIDAALAYDDAAKKLYGYYANLNL